nr:MAG TPA: hypothetical protein [Caudoviricetes sp.]
MVLTWLWRFIDLCAVGRRHPCEAKKCDPGSGCFRGHGVINNPISQQKYEDLLSAIRQLPSLEWRCKDSKFFPHGHNKRLRFRIKAVFNGRLRHKKILMRITHRGFRTIKGVDCFRHFFGYGCKFRVVLIYPCCGFLRLKAYAHDFRDKFADVYHHSIFLVDDFFCFHIWSLIKLILDLNGRPAARLQHTTERRGMSD